jgi:hypothetical protein
LIKPEKKKPVSPKTGTIEEEYEQERLQTSVLIRCNLDVLAIDTLPKNCSALSKVGLKGII